MPSIKLIKYPAFNILKRIFCSILQMKYHPKYNRFVMTIHDIYLLNLKYKQSSELFYNPLSGGCKSGSRDVLNFICNNDKYKYCIRVISVSSIIYLNCKLL